MLEKKFRLELGGPYLLGPEDFVHTVHPLLRHCAVLLLVISRGVSLEACMCRLSVAASSGPLAVHVATRTHSTQAVNTVKILIGLK